MNLATSYNLTFKCQNVFTLNKEKEKKKREKLCSLFSRDIFSKKKFWIYQRIIKIKVSLRNSACNFIGEDVKFTGANEFSYRSENFPEISSSGENDSVAFRVRFVLTKIPP